MIKLNNKKNGFTLIELMITLLLLGMVVAVIAGFFLQSNKMSETQKGEFYFQSDMRDAMALIEEKVKKSSAIFAVKSKDFQGGDNGMDKDWEYIGVATDGENKGKVCYFNFKDGDWKQIPLTTSGKEIVYSLEFYKKNKKGSGQKKLTYKLTGTPVEKGTPNEKLMRFLSTETEVLTAFTVVDWGTEDDRAVAIAFKSGEIKFNGLASITFVVDTSNSMTGWIKNGGRPRDEVLRDAIHEMVDWLHAHAVKGENMEVSIVEFSDYATCFRTDDDQDGFYSLKDEMPALNNVIDQLDPILNRKYNKLGGTNIGDGLRIAYQNVIERKKKPNFETSINYVVLVTDGLPVLRTVKKAEPYNEYYFGKEELLGKNPNGLIAKRTEGNECLVKGLGSSPYDLHSLTEFFIKINGKYTSVAGIRDSSIRHSGLRLTDFPKNYKTYGPIVPVKEGLSYFGIHHGNIYVFDRNNLPPANIGYAVAAAKHFTDRLKDVKSFIITIGAFDDESKRLIRRINVGMQNVSGDYYEGSDETQLDAAIQSIKTLFISDFWSFNGPRGKK